MQIKKYRDEEGLFIVEGRKSVLELLQSDFEIECVYSTQIYKNEITGSQYLQPKIEIVTVAELEAISRIESNNSMLAVAKMKKQEAFSYKNTTKVLILDFIQDPGNLGTIIRTADWFGIETIICSQNTVDFYNPKVITATMGSFVRVKIGYFDLLPEIQKLKESHFTIYGALLQGDNLRKVIPANKFALIIGNESNGIDVKIQNMIDKSITIEKFGKAESLNASVAAGIILQHFC